MHCKDLINIYLNPLIVASLSQRKLNLKRFKSSTSIKKRGFSFQLYSMGLLKTNKEPLVSLELKDNNLKKDLRTSSVINKILINQNLSVTASKLDKLLKVKGKKVDLSSFPFLKKETKDLLAELAGKSKYKGYFGVYIFIHKETNSKYVGSSNLLRRRLDYYLKGDFPSSGKFLPFLKEKGLKAFKLIIFKLDKTKFISDDALILEQYHLLNKEEYNLNTLKIVNRGSSIGDPIYVYDLKCKILYYHAKSKIELKRILNIHPETTKKYCDSNMPYLNKFLLLSHPVSVYIKTDISIEKLKEIMHEERIRLYLSGTRRKIAVELEIKQGNKFISFVDWGKSLKFDSLTLCHEYLKKLGLTLKRDLLTKYIKNEKIFYNFKCKYSEKVLSNNFDQLGLIIDEYKKTLEKKK